ncbi:MAG: 2-dehydropantoate 2-reductase N-terminal domain-containing protein, partial [Solirubrobacteraceae bacterium]
LILLSCKAYDLESAMSSIAPAVGPETMILPLLNGMRHLERLEERFGARALLGGYCMISTTLEGDGAVVHLNDLHLLGFGERSGARSERVAAVADELAGAGFDARPSEAILQEMWEKWVFIATGAGINCLMRGPIGDLVEAGGADLALGLLEETSAIAAAAGFAPGEAAATRNHRTFAERGALTTASMLKDLEQGNRVEADHVIGDLLARAPGSDPRSLLRLAYVHLKTYEGRRSREAAAG